MQTAPARSVTYHPLPHQLQVLKGQKRRTFLGAGVGAGKTDVGGLWVLQRCIETPAAGLGLIAANTYPQLIDSTLRNLYKNFQEWGVLCVPEKIPTTHRPFTLKVWTGSHWSEVLCRSLEKYETLAGVEIAWYWMDEVYQTKPEAFDLVLARCRSRTVPLNRGLLTTTLDDPASWMYEQFVEKYNEESDDVIYARTEANHHLPDGYLDDLKRTYSPRLFERMCNAKWVTLESGQVYHAWDRQVHVSEEAEFDPNLPILWAHDFNIGQDKPMSSCLCQIKKGEDGDGQKRPELHAFDEIILDSVDTALSCREFKERHWLEQGRAGVVVYGDASGKARDTRSKTTDYQIIRDEGFTNQKVPTKNPPIRERHNAVNSLLKNAAGDVRVKIHPRCKVLAKGLETVKLKTGAQYLEEETREQHVTTAFGYLIAREFPAQRTRVQSTGRLW